MTMFTELRTDCPWSGVIGVEDVHRVLGDREPVPADLLDDLGGVAIRFCSMAIFSHASRPSTRSPLWASVSFTRW